MTSGLQQLRGIMAQHGATKIYVKRLSPNDNSKNQIYLASKFAPLHFLPHGHWRNEDAELAGGNKHARLKAKLDFSWLSDSGSHDAPNAQLILYPKYPEIRLSGILRGCRAAPSELINSRIPGRVLFLGTTPAGKILARVAGSDDPFASALSEASIKDDTSLLADITTGQARDNRVAVLLQMGIIHARKWHDAVRLKDGAPISYIAQNAAGYTLEAALGISPNGEPMPDYLGWEIKQYAVNNLDERKPKSPITLMTPEPTGGFYREQGFGPFMKRYGYPAVTGQPGRINFGGIYRCGLSPNHLTGLTLVIRGYDFASGKISDMENGCLALVDRQERIAASWGLATLMEHWVRKHAHALYIPSIKRTSPSQQYAFGQHILLCEDADFGKLMNALANGKVYYDPASKIEHSPRAKQKRRSQFRIAFHDLELLYMKSEYVDISSVELGEFDPQEWTEASN